MHVKELVNEWASTARIEHSVMNVGLHLPLELNARLMALEDMYPGRTMEQLMLDLLSAAVDELEETLPYQPGNKVIAEDEYGDPMYQDVGLTPRFLELTQYHREKLKMVEKNDESMLAHYYPSR